MGHDIVGTRLLWVGLGVGPKGQLSRWALWLLLSRVKPPSSQILNFFLSTLGRPCLPWLLGGHGHVDILFVVVIPVWRRDRGLWLNTHPQSLGQAVWAAIPMHIASHLELPVLTLPWSKPCFAYDCSSGSRLLGTTTPLTGPGELRTEIPLTLQRLSHL